MNIFNELEFNEEWIVLGIITPAKLKVLEAKWTTGEDPNTEHYRWGAFLEFVDSRQFLDADTARALYKLGANDPDTTMGGAMMAHILRRQDCPKDLLESAAKCEESFLRKIANKRLATDVGR
jgi:hypothetical protein